MRAQESVMGRELPTLRNQPNQVALEVLYTKAGSWGGDTENSEAFVQLHRRKMLLSGWSNPEREY